MPEAARADTGPEAARTSGAGDDAPAALAPLTALLFLAEMAASFGMFTVPVLAPAAAADVGVEASLIGVFSALVFAGAMISSTLASHAISRLGPIRTNQASALSLAAALSLTASGSAPAIAVSGLWMGLSYGVLTPASSVVLLARCPPSALPLVFSLRQSGNPLGAALAGAVAPAFALAFGWREAALAVAATLLVVAAALQSVRAAVDAEVPPGRGPSFRALFAQVRIVVVDARLRELSLASFPFGAMQACIGAFLVVYLVDELGTDLVTAGLALSTAQIAGMIGRVGWGAVAGRLVATRRLLGLIGLVMSLAAAATAFWDTGWPLPLILAVSAVLGATGTGWSGIFLAELTRLAPPGQTSQAVGAVSAISFAGSAFGPALFTAFVASAGSFGAGYLCIAALTLVPGIALLRAATGGESGR